MELPSRYCGALKDISVADKIDHHDDIVTFKPYIARWFTGDECVGMEHVRYIVGGQNE